MYGIAKKFNKEMEDLPIYTHSAVVEMIRVGMQHRDLKMQAEDRARKEAFHAEQAEQQRLQNERAIKAQEEYVALEKARQQQTDAERLKLAPGPTLVAQ